MRNLSLAAAALALTIGFAAPPATADGPKASSGNRIEPDTAAGVPRAASAASHYEWQYRYVGHHARYEGHWVLVN